jgi:hypothetical protein
MRGGVFLNSTGTRSSATNSDRRTDTVTTLSNGGTITSFNQETATNTIIRSTGGAVTGLYGGTVGVAQSANSSSSINQNATTTSAATISGTIVADFFGSARAQDLDEANLSTNRQQTQSSGASTREQWACLAGRSARWPRPAR